MSARFAGRATCSTCGHRAPRTPAGLRKVLDDLAELTDDPRPALTLLLGRRPDLIGVGITGERLAMGVGENA